MSENLIANGTFEQGHAGERHWNEWGHVTNVLIPGGWTSFWYRGRVEDGTEKPWEWKRPEAVIQHNRWRCFCAYASWRACLMQQVRVIPGHKYRLSARAYGESASKNGSQGEISSRLMVSLLGNAGPGDAGTQMASPYLNQNKRDNTHELEFYATTETITVYLDTYNKWAEEWNYIEWTNVELVDITEPKNLEKRVAELETRVAGLLNWAHGYDAAVDTLPRLED